MRTPAIALGLSVVFVLGGCSEDPQPRIGAAPSSPTSATPTPTSSPTGSPATTETPQQFIQRWFDAGVAMQSTGDTTDFESLNGDCDPCKDLAASVRGYYSAGGYVRPAAVEVLSVQKTGGPAEYLVTTSAGRTTVKESETAPAVELRGGPGEYTVRLRQDGQSWRMLEYSVEVGR